MTLRRRIASIVDGMPSDARVSLSVEWLRRQLEAEPESGDLDAVLTLEDVAAELDVAVSTVRTWCNQGELDGFKLNGRAWRVRRSALEDYLTRQADPEPEVTALDRRGDVDLGSWRRHRKGGAS